MNPKLNKLLMLAGLLAVSLHARSGSPDGLLVLVVPTPAAKVHLAPIVAFFDNYSPGGKGSHCAGGSLNLDHVSFVEARHKIEPGMALAAASDAKQRKRLAKALVSYRGKLHPRGFDAALLVDVNAGQVELYGVSGDDSEKPYKATLPVPALQTSSRLQNAMCLALGELPVLEAP